MTDRELMQEALYALTYVGDAKEIYSDTIESLRARLAQPEPEPVAQVDYNERGNIQWLFGKQIPDKTFLYTAPPQREEAPAKAVEWQGLTDEESYAIFEEARHGSDKPVGVLRGIRAIEAKLKEKNT